MKTAATLLAYLRNPKFLDDVKNGGKVLTYANRKDITNLARDIYIRLFHKEDPFPDENDADDRQNHPQGDPSNEEDHGDGAPPAKKSCAKKIWAVLEENKQKARENCETASATKASNASSSTSILNDIKSDMKYFESRGQRSTMLAEIYRALLSIPPTSCEAER